MRSSRHREWVFLRIASDPRFEVQAANGDRDKMVKSLLTLCIGALWLSGIQAFADPRLDELLERTGRLVDDSGSKSPCSPAWNW